MADELAQFSFLLLLQSRAIARSHCTILSHVGNVIVTVSSHLRMCIATVHMNIIKCGYCSRAATITLSPRSLLRLFEGGVYSGCGVYSRKYGTLNFSHKNCLLLDTHNTNVLKYLLLSEGLLSKYTLLLSQLDVQSHPMQSMQSVGVGRRS